MTNNFKIYAVFPGCGKTYLETTLFDKYDIIDFDFYNFKYHSGKRTNWLNSYLERLDQLKSKFDYVLINAVPEILSEIKDLTGVIYPHRSLKDEWINRIKQRNPESQFSNTLEQNWDKWIDACEEYNGYRFILSNKQYLIDVWENII